MSSRGRKRHPPELAEVNGYYKRHPERRNVNASKADGKEPPMPSYFDEGEADAWEKTVSEMRQIGSLSSDIGAIIEAYCVAYAGWLKLKKRIEEEGETVECCKANGAIEQKRHPLLQDMHKYRDQANKLIPDLGLSPANRSKFSVGEKKEVDPFEQWLSGGGLSDN